jgi:hypothetical protein
VAGRDHDEKLRHARLAYISASRRLQHALQRFDDSGIPMDPGPDPLNPLPWTREQTQTVRAVASAFGEVYQRRHEWWQLRRTRPYQSAAQQPGRAGG